MKVNKPFLLFPRTARGQIRDGTHHRLVKNKKSARVSDRHNVELIIFLKQHSE